MIVSYLVIAQGMRVNDAIQLFAEARPPGIYKCVSLLGSVLIPYLQTDAHRQQYINELLSRHGDSLAVPPIVTQPDWAKSQDGKQYYSNSEL